MNVNVDVPEELWAWAQAMVDDGFCASPGQYIADLLDEDKARVLRAMSRAEAGEGAEPMTPELFHRIQAAAAERVEKSRATT